MKHAKLFLTAVIIGFATNLNAQWTTTPGNETTPGNCNVGGDINLAGQLKGNTTGGSLGMYANTNATNGPAVEVFGGSHGSFWGQIHYDSYFDGTTGTLADDGHVFQNYDPTAPIPGWYRQMSISKNGILSVYGSRIQGHQSGGYLGMFANTYTTDGAGVEVFANAGVDANQIHITSNGLAGRALAVQTYVGGGTFNGLMNVNNDGTVEVLGSRIQGKQSGGYLGMFANTYTTDGSGIEVFANTHASSGDIHLSTGGTVAPGRGITFQHYNSGSGAFDPLMKVNNDGTVEVYGSHIQGKQSGGYLGMFANNYTTDGSGVEVFANTHGTFQGEVHITANNVHTRAITLQTYASGAFKQLMAIDNNGAVIISDGTIPTPSPGVAGGYNLYVQHGILTEKLKVAVAGSTPWSDFVFNKDYSLMPLDEVESYVKKNKHLPEIPSAKEVGSDGIDVASMDAKLLQKIEELTLYVIQQQKRLDKQQNEIDLLNKKKD